MGASSFLHITKIVAVYGEGEGAPGLRKVVIALSSGSSFVALLMAIALISLCRSHGRAKKGAFRKTRTPSQGHYSRGRDGSETAEERFEHQLKMIR